MINLICAVNEDFAIGNSKTNDLLYYISDDLKRFRWLTKDSYVVMGRNTFLSLPKPLPNRTNVVLTRDAKFTIEDELNECYDIIIENNLEKILNQYSNTGCQSKELFLIGGSNIFAEGIKWADRLFLTMIHDKDNVDGNIYFPKQELINFTKTSRFDEYDEKTGLHYSFLNYKRK